MIHFNRTIQFIVQFHEAHSTHAHMRYRLFMETPYISTLQCGPQIEQLKLHQAELNSKVMNCLMNT